MVQIRKWIKYSYSRRLPARIAGSKNWKRCLQMLVSSFTSVNLVGSCFAPGQGIAVFTALMVMCRARQFSSLVEIYPAVRTNAAQSRNNRVMPH